MQQTRPTNLQTRAAFHRQRVVVTRCCSTLKREQSLHTRGAVLCSKWKAHDASLTSALVLQDEPGCKIVITGSLDKTLIQTTLQGCDLDGTTRHTQRLEVPGAPVFSLTRAQPVATGGADSPKKQHPPRPSVWAGLAAKDIVSWDPAAGALNSKVRMNGHTGWVRSLATSGKWLFSCGCNHLRQWDTTLAVPKEVHRETLATGDILRIATGGGRVFTAGADGSLRSWLLPKAGHMQPGISREKAHEGQRVTALAYHAGMVYTVSYDGMIKAWDAESLNLVMEVRAAHDGARIQCATIGSDGYLYTGGDDALVRRWDVVELSPASEPLHVHGSSVRVLAAGSKDCLLSGDASGEVAVWSL